MPNLAECTRTSSRWGMEEEADFLRFPMDFRMLLRFCLVFAQGRRNGGGDQVLEKSEV